MPSGMKYQKRLQNTRVLVLGGSSGIGFCVAEAALEQGAIVIISGSTQNKLDNAIARLVAEYPDSKGKISSQTCDLSDPVHMEENVERLLKVAAGDSKINHIVFTAGDVVKLTKIAEATPESIQNTGMVRFVGSLMVAKHAPKYMHGNDSSSVTLTGGTNSTKPSKGWTINASYGSGNEGMARGLAVDLAPIRVNLISPGKIFPKFLFLFSRFWAPILWYLHQTLQTIPIVVNANAKLVIGAIHTELFDNFVPKEALKGFLKEYADASLLDKVGRPEECAEAYIYCMRCDFATGSVIQVDGGRLLK